MFSPPSNVNVIGLREEKMIPSNPVTVADSDSTLLLAWHTEFSWTVPPINLLWGCLLGFFFLFFISLCRLLVRVLTALFVTCLLSLKDLFCLVNCFIACVYFVQIPKMVTIHCSINWVRILSGYNCFHSSDFQSVSLSCEYQGMSLFTLFSWLLAETQGFLQNLKLCKLKSG